MNKVEIIRNEQSFDFVEVFLGIDEVGDFFWSASEGAGNQLLQKFMLFGTQLLDDVRQQVLDCLGLSLARNDESIILNWGIGYINRVNYLLV